MDRRLELQALLEILLESDKVYFQPPTNIAMVYPAIVYGLDDIETTFADNHPYRHTKRYQVTVIVRDPDSPIPDRLGALPMCLFSRHFRANNLNHYVYNLYF